MNNYMKSILLGATLIIFVGSASASIIGVEPPVNSIAIEFTYIIDGKSQSFKLNGLAGKRHKLDEVGYVHMKCKSNDKSQIKTLGQDLLKTGIAADYAVAETGLQAIINVMIYPPVQDVSDQVKSVKPNECTNISPLQPPITTDYLTVDYTEEPKEMTLPNTGVRIKYHFYKI